MALNDNKNDDITDIGDDDIAWLKQLIDEDFERFELPQSLKSENLIHRLDDIQQEPVKPVKNNKVVYLKFISAAACLALVIFGWQHLDFTGNTLGVDMSSQQAAAKASQVEAAEPLSLDDIAADEESFTVEPVEEEVIAYAADSREYSGKEYRQASAATPQIDIPEQPSAKSYDEVFSAISSMRSANTEEVVAEDAVIAVPSEGGNVVFSAKSSVYKTNAQVAGVDEADIVKTDGKYIYHYRFDSSEQKAEIMITSADGLKAVSSLPLDGIDGAEMYIAENRLILIGNMNREKAQKLSDSRTEPLSDYLGESHSAVETVIPEYSRKHFSRSTNFTETVIFDIENVSSPKEIKRFQQDGGYLSSRMSGDMLYIVSSKPIYSGGIFDGIEARYCLPYAGESGSISPLSAENILLPSYREDFSYAVVSSINSLTGKTDTKAVLGMADEIMMSQNSLYLTATAYGSQHSWRDRSTGISKFAITADGLKFIADTMVDGYIDNQFSLDEHNGDLRIATTSYNSDNQTVNNLYVFDSALKQKGALEGLAVGERIYSVRYVDSTAYVVTFKETDPLFVIDLSDPTKPTVKGQLKLPGFSEYLHPIDENTLIGLGNNTVTLKNGGVITDGLKLSLFDVSDPFSPKEKYSCLIGNRGSDSPALQNHKAFMYYPKKGIFGFPATIYTSYGASANDPYSGESRLSFSGYMLLRASENEFELLATLSPAESHYSGSFMRNDLDSAIERGIYIDNTVYTVSDSGITAYSLDTLSQIAAIKY